MLSPLTEPLSCEIMTNGTEVASTPSGSVSLGGSEEIAGCVFEEELLRRHNELRRQHFSAELSLNRELCELAQDQANKIARKHHLSYSELTGIGENITIFPVDLPPREIVDYWYREERRYEEVQYQTPGWQVNTNYFTQLIWSSTKEVCQFWHDIEVPILLKCEVKIGVGRARLRPAAWLRGNQAVRPEEQVVVCFYRPAGNNNRAGQFMANVNEPLSQ